MRLTPHITTLILIIWNTVVFLCSIIPFNNTKEKKNLIPRVFKAIYKTLIITYNILKEFTNKILLKTKNNNAAQITAASKNIYKNKKSASSRSNNNNTLTKIALKSANILQQKKLKDAQATQILISKHYFSCLEDKCAFLYPLYHCSLYNL